MQITEQDKILIQRAIEVIEKNFDNVNYNHTVGCALLCKNGNIYTGVNCDGNHGSCAEYITIGSAISAGEREFDTMVAVHKDAKNNILPPCGNCRQMMSEYCPNIKVLVNNDDGQIVKVTIKELLPYTNF